MKNDNFSLCWVVDGELIFMHCSLLLNEFNTELQGMGKTADIMFYNIKAYEIELELLNVMSTVPLLILIIF
jgi:hypothetical protein